ncbi:MAG: glycosyltransferase family 4 protein, partial [Dehalococcoidia bacterium]
MKILMFVSNPFTHDARVYTEATSLFKAGHEITVIARNYYKENPSEDTQDGIKIIRLASIMKPQNISGKILGTRSSLLFWQWRAYRKAISLYKEYPYDIVHCHDLDTLAIGAKLKHKYKLNLVYDAHEIYGYMAARVIPRFAANIFLWLERWLIKTVDHLVTSDDRQSRYFRMITNKPLTIIMNCKSLESYEYRAPSNENTFTILYIGSLHKGRAIIMLIDVVQELPDVKCIIGGIGAPAYVRSLTEKCEPIPNIDFIGKVPFDKVIPMTMNSDSVFMMVDPEDLNNRDSLANKQFEAMVCGRPIICTEGTYSGELTEQERVGISVAYDKEALKQAILSFKNDQKLREELGRNALQAAINKYNWEK